MRRPTIQTIISAAVVGVCVAFVFKQMNPGLLFANNTPAGGDMGAHVWAPAYLRDHLLPHWRLSGWAPDAWAGFPAFTFYFPLPSLLIVALDVLLPYGVAFKLVTILGVVTLPVAAYLFGKLSGLRFPGPPVLAVATLPFLFDTSFTIYGGNIPSTLAGEFSFSLSLSFALVFLGVVSRGLETGRHRGWAAALLALTALSHLLPTIFAVVGAAILLLLKLDRRRIRYLATVGALALALAGFWAIPFIARLPYSNDMGWTKVTEYFKALFPAHFRLFFVLAIVGAISAFGLRVRAGIIVLVIAIATGVLFVVVPEGRVWNARLLPFWYLSVYLLAGVGAAEVGRSVAGAFSRDPEKPRASVMTATPVVVLAAALVLVGGPLQALPTFLPVRPGTTSFVGDWVKWNYSGYEGKAAYPEYRALMKTMGSLPCGRAMWEYSSDLNRYGTTMAMMLLPYWTHGCIASMEGLYFESSATVPFHFINASELSNAPSNPQSGLPYQTLNVAQGVKHLQLLGVRYYMTYTVQALKQAVSNPDLELVKISGPWHIFEIAHSPLVEGLGYKPVVVVGVGRGQKGWLRFALPFYLHPGRWDVFLATRGPGDWGRVKQGRAPPKTPVLPARVDQVRSAGNHISFRVNHPGSPVLVKVSYFPNWKALGAEGPWRVAPNLMVVVPTQKQVELRYGYAPVDIFGWLLTLLGVATLVRFARRRPGPADGDDTLQEHTGPSAGGPQARVSVVIPAFNEEEILRSSVTEIASGLRKRGDPFEIVVVENGSTDQTRTEALRIADEISELRVASLSAADYGRALREGLLVARGEFVVNFDADYYDLDFAGRAISLLEQQDGPVIVVGSKRLEGATDARSWARRSITAIFAFALHAGFGSRISDTHGMKAMRRQAVTPLARRCRFNADLFDTELILRAEREGLRIAAVPVVVEERRPSRTPVVGRATRTVFALTKLWMVLKRERVSKPAAVETSTHAG